MSTSVQRRLGLRAAASSVVLLSALALPAAAHADGSATPAPSLSSTAGDKGGNGQGPVTPAGVLVHTDTLKGGLVAQVYKFGTDNPYYTADITKGGKVAGSLTAGFGYQATASHVYGDTSVTLYADGRITSAADKGGSGQGPVTPVGCTAATDQNIGGGTTALLTISPSGPSVLFRSAGEKGVIPGLELDRKHPKLPAGHFAAEILRPNSATPQLRTSTQGGGHASLVTDFPRLPKGCAFTYSTTSGGPQTAVIPQGSVAAGYQAPAGDHASLLAVGGATAALGAAGIAFVAVRRRTAATR
ncbi:hypothetical protein [Streptomyces sp. NBC_01198]|uniref:hypothetical protein n=1 Tax=Streptomyces sp. NBC_01198 TaxID=2903769 RepID=UPI002E14594F|nr:hypothetical protein OG702_15490 [Streptomyces sp. NBC_01198]